MAVILALLAVPSWTSTLAEERDPIVPSARHDVEEPNPYLSFLPAEARPDWEYWRAEGKRRAVQRRHDLERGVAGTFRDTGRGAEKGSVAESEPNDLPITADIPGNFGTGPGKNPAIDFNGTFATFSAPSIGVPSPEDEGSIPLASETSLITGGARRYSGTIGDGPHGSSGTGTGDYDFFRIAGVEAGQLILVDLDTPAPFGDLDPFIVLYDAAGQPVRPNDNEDPFVSLDSFLAVSAPANGDYYLSIGGSRFGDESALVDPFDSSSGPGQGSEGNYVVTIGLDRGDPDWLALELETCDILGVNLLGAGYQALLTDADGNLLTASTQDVTFLYPMSSSLPGGGTAALAFVAPSPGTYYLRVLGEGGPGYDLELRLYRPPSRSAATPKTLFLDFDGATVDPAIFDASPGEVELSPLSSFLGQWGFSPADENALIDRILAIVEQKLASDPELLGPNDSFGIRLRNSRDHLDPFGDPDVSRLVVGGSIAELGLITLGIAQSIDPGDFAAAETAVVLLDLLSGSAMDANSLNGIALAPGASKLELVSHGLGNIVAHEAGHLLGNFHTDQLNELPGLMDLGGNLPNILGLGPDEIFGSADDDSVSFIEDRFVNAEGFAGHEDTLAVVSCGCSYAADTLFTDGFESGSIEGWTGDAARP